jgi:predicted O-methyltransferase YrrM
MDPERFVEELPQLFDDFPRSEHPRGRRFDDILAEVPNLARENNLALLNLAASLLDTGESYVEVGTYHGASLIAAMRGNEDKDFVGIDNFTIGEVGVGGVDRPRPTRKSLERNLERFGATGATILEGDAFELIESGALDGRRAGAYYYDASHAYEAQVRGLQIVEPYLAERALLIVDDSDWEQVERAVRDYVAAQPRARVLVEIGGESKGQPQWWEGMVVLGWYS